MALTTDQMAQITSSVLNGTPISIDTPEARSFAEKVKVDVAVADKNGWIIEIPLDP